jgi:hypothetical protein
MGFETDLSADLTVGLRGTGRLDFDRAASLGVGFFDGAVFTGFFGGLDDFRVDLDGFDLGAGSFVCFEFD